MEGRCYHVGGREGGGVKRRCRGRRLRRGRKEGEWKGGGREGGGGIEEGGRGRWKKGIIYIYSQPKPRWREYVE